MKSSRTFALVTTLFETDLLCPPTRPTAFAALVATKLILTFLVHRGGGRVLVLLLLASCVSALRPLRTFRFFSYPIASQPLFRGRDVVHSISSVFSETFPILFPPSARAESEIDRQGEDGHVPRASGLDADAQGAPHAGDGAPSRRKRLAKGREQDPRGERAGTNRARCSFPSLAALSGTDYPSNVPRRSARGRDPGPSGHGVRGGILPAQRHRPVKVSAAPILSCSKDDKNTLWADSLSLSLALSGSRGAQVPVRAPQRPVRYADLPPEHRLVGKDMPRHAEHATQGSLEAVPQHPDRPVHGQAPVRAPQPGRWADGRHRKPPLLPPRRVSHRPPRR